MAPFNVMSALQGDFSNQSTSQWFQWIEANYCVDEDIFVDELLAATQRFDAIAQPVQKRAQHLVEKVRAQNDFAHAVDKLLQEYSLDNEEGVILMCLAEALMRIPDSTTADKLIADKISPAQWDTHLGQSDSLLVNASTWGLMLTGKVTKLSETSNNVSGLVKRLVSSAGEPVIRAAMHQAMKIMGKQFVLGRTISEAIKNGKESREKGYTYSFDMLGEAALTDDDATRYFDAYLHAIQSVGEQAGSWNKSRPTPSVSIKLSALHPRYESTHESMVLRELSERLLTLCVEAKHQGIAISVDAEEADRLELSLKLFAQVLQHESLEGWGQLGIVVQAYSKRALPVLGFISALAEESQVRIPVRLVKGAYWDSEIKWAQVKGQTDYPVFTKKENTDVSYLVCADFLLEQQKAGAVEPQFATHNAHTVGFIEELARAKNVSGFEFQRLHGMGDALYDLVVSDQRNVRIYAPVGAHKDLLPYLVRRLLENGANSSFVHRLVDEKTPIQDLIVAPQSLVSTHKAHRNSAVALPANLFGSERQNSKGHNIQVAQDALPLQERLAEFAQKQWQALPVVETQSVVEMKSPFDASLKVGDVHWTSAVGAKSALTRAHDAFNDWRSTPVSERAEHLRKMADALEEHEAEFLALCQREAGKTIQDSIDEIREAVDFLRYYAAQAEQLFGMPTVLNGPTGESNEHYFEGRGVFVCISPWNFPLAIFLGQIAAALVAGNTVIAKPAETTSLIAARAIELFHQVGLPENALLLVPGSGAEIGQALLSDTRVAGVAFTGSTETAKRINRQLAERDGAIATFIAETGGNNTMIVDSTALPEQVVLDAMHSAFASAGQRCSALRVLCVQEDIVDRIVTLLKGSMSRWQVGNPLEWSTDAGPVIDAAAQKKLTDYITSWRVKQAVLMESALPASANKGYFVAPTLIQIESLQQLGAEQFGPILHILPYKAKALDTLLDDINAMGYGLTLGIHSRNEQTASYIEARVRVGNCYVNRNQIGAVVGVQPFGGCGLSGTGPKAGGPNYLQRFATERTRTINTTAVGGNATLLAQSQSSQVIV